MLLIWIAVSTSQTGLQQQIDALADFCAGWRLEVSPTNPWLWYLKADAQLGYVMHETHNMAYEADQMVHAARKDMHPMCQRCILSGLSDPASTCKLFDMLVLPILSYACEV